MPGLPDDCAIERASHPERLGALTWVSCGSGLPSCRRDDADYLHEAWAIDGEVWVTNWFDRDVEALLPIDGVPLAAWREPTTSPAPCGVYDVAAGGGNAAVAIAHYSDAFPARSGYSIYAGPREEIGSNDTPTAQWLGIPSGVATNLHVSGSAFAYRESTGFVALYGYDGTWTRMSGFVPGTPDPIMLVGDHVLWQAWTSVSRLAHGSVDIPPAVFRDAAPDDLLGLAADDDTIAWQLGLDIVSTGVYARVELWAADYQRDVAMLAPRLVRAMSSACRGRLGGRWYGCNVGDAPPYETMLVDLSDGTVRRFTPPGGDILIDQPILVSERAVLVQTTDGFYRFDPHELPIEP